MTVTVANVANTNTFDYWRNRTNELAAAMSTKVVSVESTNAVGNAAISGTFTANVLSANLISIANATVSVNVGVPTLSQKSTGTYYLNANGNWATVVSPTTTGSAEISTLVSNTIDSYLKADFKAVEYVMHLKSNTSVNGYQVSKLLTYHNLNGAFVTEYGVMNTNGVLGTFNAFTNTTHVVINCTPTTTNTYVTFARTNV